MLSLASKYIVQKISLLSFIVIFLSVNFLFPNTSCSYQLSPFSVNIIGNNEISVSASLSVEPKFVEDLREGMTKELIFYVDLFRVWNIWPDEFVKGKKIIKTLKSDPIKREYIAVSTEGNVSVEKRFKDIESMLSWSLNIIDIKISGIKDLEPGKYFIKVTAEATKKRLPPLIGYFLFFVSENEFSTSRNSQTFQLPKETAK